MYSHPALATAMCAALAPGELVAINIELPEDGSVPEWLELIPAGPEVVGRDGRAWLLDRPDEVVANSLGGRDLPLDWEHSTEIKAPKGEPAPAAGWVTELQNRGGAVWGRVEWTPRGREAVANREYRYISPVFLFDKATRRIVRLKSAGLTNSPNLHLTALNRGTDPGSTDHEETAMKLSEALRKALGLAEEATEADALTAINRMKDEHRTALNRADNPSLEKFVPRADYDQALERATNAEQALADREKETLEAEIEAAINQALEAGKITPATVDYHKASCREKGGLERFKKYVEAAPAVADPTDLDGKKPDGEKDQALNAEQARIAAMFGNSAEDLAKYAG